MMAMACIGAVRTIGTAGRFALFFLADQIYTNGNYNCGQTG